jgi:PST family polysaccharide transporter
MALKIKAARGVLWSLLEYGGGEGISFVVFLVLARLLVPESFGIVALAGVFVAFVQVFLVQGFMDAVIQRKDLEPEHLDTAFWTNQAIAGGFLVLTQLAAGPAAAAFGQPLLEDVLRWLSLVFLSTSLISIHQAVFKRELRFAAFAARAIVGITAGGVVGIAMAMMGYGVWSLVGQQLTNGAASVIVLWSTSQWRPRLRFSWKAFDDMARFSAHVIGSNLVGFLHRKLDVFLIGFFLDPKQLGYYYLVQRLVMATGLVTLSTVQSIVMPVLSRLQAEPARFRQVYGSTVQVVQAIYLPAVVGLGAVGSILIPFIFGAQWRPAVPLLEIMCLVGFTQALSFFSGPALWAAGHAEAFLKLSIVQVAVTAALFLPATQFGIAGVAAAYTAVTAGIIPFHLWVMRRHTGVDPLDLLKRCLPSAAAGLAMIFTVELAEQRLMAEWPPLVGTLSLAVLGAGVYLLALTAVSPGLVREVLALLLAAIAHREATAPRERAATGGAAS